MPIFEFKCKKCNTTVEKLLTMAEQASIFLCEKCKNPLEKVEFSLSSFQLKGTGWFKDGYSKRN